DVEVVEGCLVAGPGDDGDLLDLLAPQACAVGVDVGLDLVRRRRPLRLQLVAAPATLTLVIQDHEECPVQEVRRSLRDDGVAELQPLLYSETTGTSVCPHKHLFQGSVYRRPDESGPSIATRIDRWHPHEGQRESPIARSAHL